MSWYYRKITEKNNDSQSLRIKILKKNKKKILKNKAPIKPSKVIKTGEQDHVDKINQ